MMSVIELIRETGKLPENKVIFVDNKKYEFISLKVKRNSVKNFGRKMYIITYWHFWGDNNEYSAKSKATI